MMLYTVTPALGDRGLNLGNKG